jgi:phosphoribosylglycinamide formyltransferase-1
MQLPEAEESVSHGMACFGIVKGKKFAWVSADHHGDGKCALLVKISGADEQEQLIESDPDRFYRPAYFGDGWIGVRLDLGDVDWDDIAEWLRRSSAGRGAAQARGDDGILEAPHVRKRTDPIAARLRPLGTAIVC